MARPARTDHQELHPRGKGAETKLRKAEARRQEQLELMREQVQIGTLVIRQMTDEERLLNPPRPVNGKPNRSRRS
jgi:hypothetical protein